jgi:flagellar biosynthesis/type III secretory pathway chaperone
MSVTVTPQQAILDLLDQEYRLYTRLIALAELQRDALVENDIDALTPLVRELDGVSLQIVRLEQQRTAHVGAITGDPESSVSALAPYFEPSAREQLEHLRDDLRGAMARLRALNDLNAGLIHHAIEISTRWSRLLRAAMPATYAATGTVVGPRTAGREWKG